MVLFSVLGSIEGFAEETLGFYGLIVPLMLALGYDRMVAVGAIILGAGIGCLSSTLNPFAIGVASSAAQVSISDGIGLRLAMWLVLTTVTVLYVIRYATRIKNDPSKSMVGFLPGDRDAQDEVEPPPLTRRQLSETISAGAGDFISAGLVIVLARGVAVLMNNAQITDSVLHAMEGAVDNLSSGVFAVMMFVVNLPLAFLIPSTSGHATLAMPIMAPLGDFADVSRSLVITAWAAASGWMNLWVPTTAVVMGGLTLGKVGYDKYLRFIAPLLGILFVLVCGFLVLGATVLG